MSEENQTDNPDLITPETSSEQYSVAMVDTIFADTLSRGMQNAITSQQNAQMASASSVTNACARILQAKAKPIEGPIQAQSKPVQQSHPDAAQMMDKAVSEKPHSKEVKAPQDASNTQSGSVSGRKFLLMLIASTSLSAVIAGAFVSTYFVH